MASPKSLLLCFLMLAVFTAETWACVRRQQSDDDKADDGAGDSGGDSGGDSDGKTTSNACCVCGQAVSMKIKVINMIQEPYFEIDTDVKGKPQRELLHLLEVAAGQDKRFRFSADYFGSLGYMVTRLNELSASESNKTYWSIHSSTVNNNALTMGVSLYMPVDEEIVTFNFTNYA